jgi:hypothetical protein
MLAADRKCTKRVDLYNERDPTGFELQPAVDLRKGAGPICFYVWSQLSPVTDDI